MISRAQPTGFLRKNRVKITVAFDLPFTKNIAVWLRYSLGLSPTDWTWKVKWGVARWQGWTHCVSLLSIPLVGI